MHIYPWIANLKRVHSREVERVRAVGYDVALAIVRHVEIVLIRFRLMSKRSVDARSSRVQGPARTLCVELGSEGEIASES